MTMQRHTSRHIGNGHKNAGLQHHVRTNHRTVFMAGVCFIHEFDDYGNHRIGVNGTYSDWAVYREFCKVRISEGWAVGCTDNYKDFLPEMFLMAEVKGG